MGANFTPKPDDELEIEMTWQGNIDNVKRVVFDAAEYLYGKDNEREFSDLSNQEKLNILYNHFRDVAVNAANTWTSTEAQRIAREANIPHEL